MLISLSPCRTNQICSAPLLSAAVTGSAAAAAAAPAAATNARRDSRGPPSVVIFVLSPRACCTSSPRFGKPRTPRAATSLHLRRRAEYAPRLTFFDRLPSPNKQLTL